MERELDGAFRSAVAKHGSGPAVVDSAGSFSYTALDGLADRLAREIRRVDRTGGRIGLLLPNVPAFPAALHAVFRVGRSGLLIVPRNSRREVAEFLTETGVGAVVTLPGLDSLIPLEVARIHVDRTGTPIGSVDAAGVGREVMRGPETAGLTAGGNAVPTDEAVVIFTSATAGRARGAVLTHANLVTNATATADAASLSPADRVAAVLPFAHAFGLTVCLNGPLLRGASVVPVDRFNPLSLLRLLEEAQITVLAGVPSLFASLLVAAERLGRPRHTLRLALCGGAPMPYDLGHRWERLFGIPLRQGYGLTEASPVCTFNGMDRPNRLGTLGVPLKDVEVSIRDLAGTPLPDGEVGEICIRGPNVFSGYLDGVREGVFYEEGWLRTGDLGSIRDGSVRFHGTVKPMFTRNGFNVYPEEIRRVVMSDPAVREATVYGRPDVIREYEVVLEVRPRRPGGLTTEDVAAVCRTKLASYKQPSEIRIVQ